MHGSISIWVLWLMIHWWIIVIGFIIAIVGAIYSIYMLTNEW